ncbi:hypothetical protein X975_23405, partial [Stegodyphus mimosarum]
MHFESLLQFFISIFNFSYNFANLINSTFFSNHLFLEFETRIIAR